MSTNEKHTEKIKCPDCGTIQDATVEHTVPFHTYLHICTKCDFTIMESEWQVVSTNEKQLTAVQMLRETLVETINVAKGKLTDSQYEIFKYTIETTIAEIDKRTLPAERQQLIDFHTICCKNGLERENEKYSDEDVELIKQHAIEHFNNTFKQ